MMKAVGDHLPIPGFSEVGTENRLGALHVAYLALDGAAVELAVSESGMQALGVDSALRELVARVGYNLAQSGTLALDAPNTRLGSWRVAGGDQREARLYVPADQTARLVAKHYPAHGGEVQYDVMAAIHAALIPAFAGKTGMKLDSPAQLANFSSPSGESVIIMERARQTRLLSDFFDRAMQEDDVYSQAYQDLEGVLERIQAELKRVLGPDMYKLINDIDDGRNILAAEDFPGNITSEPNHEFSIIDQPDTAAMFQWIPVEKVLQSLGYRFHPPFERS